ncbi:MAG: aspartyl protease family protein [Candidatus Thiosymbion ectosymbiont of Robbea hypermnestra]|nr:aspartyl protease family protein [Candidatus Thiosymbion ectosymbiont of Robbea hypermnestra]
MGTFHVGCQIENHQNSSKFIKINKLLVDTGAEHTWIRETKLSRIGITPMKKDVPFRMANGQLITRNIGFMIIRINKSFTVDEVVFAQKEDLELLGARSLEGLNLSVDSKRKKLVAAGPYPVA